jgi:hypothetical protein
MGEFDEHAHLEDEVPDVEPDELELKLKVASSCVGARNHLTLTTTTTM